MFNCKTCGEQAGFTTGAPTQVVFCSCYTVDIAAERVRLAAENAELRDMEQCSHELFEAACNDLGDAQEQLAAANATLDALREAVQSDEWIYAKHTDTDGQMGRIEDILYPQPAALAEENDKS